MRSAHVLFQSRVISRRPSVDEGWKFLAFLNLLAASVSRNHVVAPKVIVPELLSIDTIEDCKLDL
jgi:hypothetical protein